MSHMFAKNCLGYSGTKKQGLTSAGEKCCPPLTHPAPHSTKWCLPSSTHLRVQVQSLKVAIENETLYVAIQGEIRLAAKSVHTHIMPVLIVEDTTSTHRGVTRPWLDGAAA